MKLFYIIGIQLYQFIIGIVALFSNKAWLWKKGRENQFPFWKVEALAEKRKVAWFHCASLGEFEQARPVIEQYKYCFPERAILLTFFSPSGFEVRKNYPLADYIYYLPIDTNNNANEWVSSWNLVEAFFVKYEFWHFYSLYLFQKQIPFYSFSTIFRPNQIYFKWYGSFFLEIVKRHTHIFVQNIESRELLNHKSITHVSVAGDTRFDRVFEISQKVNNNPIVAHFSKGTQKVIILGSVWAHDLEIFKPIYKEIINKYKVIIAPHELNEDDMSWIESSFSGKTIRYSEYNETESCNTLILNTMGMLSSLYQYAEIVYVGGAFGKGLHNILEPTTFGKPVIFGPKYQKFQEAKDLINLGGAFSIQNSNELQKKINTLLTNKDAYQKASEICKTYVKSHIGASKVLMNFLQKTTP